MSTELLFGLAGIVLLIFVVDRIRRRKSEAPELPGPGPVKGQQTHDDVDRWILAGKKIQAIKVYRALHDVGLKEAKEAVEARERELRR